MGELPAQAVLALGLGTQQGGGGDARRLEPDGGFRRRLGRATPDLGSWLAAQSAVPHLRDDIDRALALSATVLKVHQDRTYCGAAVASLSVPWGDSSQSRGGYHLVWPRDLVETAGALVALGAYDDARDMLRYLIATQQEDGHWPQNQWLGGTRVLAGRAARRGGVSDPARLRPAGAATSSRAFRSPTRSSRARALHRARRPSTQQDRWEEDAGINIFTLAVAIAGLVEASAFLEGEAKDFALKIGRFLECAP